MNPTGIPVFYGSFDPLTCISAIRVPVGGIAAAASFQLLRPVQVLDLTAFDEGPDHVSYFDRNRVEILEHMLFLAVFHREMRRPVLPQDEAIDYVPTQAVADFLANQFEPQLDGLIYSSSLTSEQGRNIVLFPDAALVASPSSDQQSSGPTRQVVGTLTEYGYVIEEPQDDESPDRSPLVPSGQFPIIDLTTQPSPLPPPPTLRYVEGSVQLARVTSIAVHVDTIPVF